MNNAFIGQAFTLQQQQHQHQHQHGILKNLNFAVKDLIDIHGCITGGGHPTWQQTHLIAEKHAASVDALLKAGARCIGKTITDELAYSLEGRNHFFGTPLNPQWPDAMPGGSSSGSASAVAQHLVDFALGTDTGGSVRVPAAFCGIWGIRPSYQAISLSGVLPFASCFDTVGWFAHDVETFLKVGEVLLPEDKTTIDLDSLSILGVAEAFSFHRDNHSQLTPIFERYAQQMGMDHIASIFSIPHEQLLGCYQYLQDASIKENLGAWIATHSPQFGPNIQANFNRVIANNGRDLKLHQDTQHAFSTQIKALLQKHILILPTTPVPLLKLDIDHHNLSLFYQQALTINAIAGLSGVPQINIPVQNTAHYPIALSIIGPPNSDRALLQLAKTLFLKSKLL